tara:strand:- start:419 stop:1093 length:675 start_codon:yes stop_codon:yes gene_type:complete
MAKNGNIHPSRIFKKPEEIEAVWERYKENNNDVITLSGFFYFCANNYGEVKRYFNNQQNYYDDYNKICKYIKDYIFTVNLNRYIKGEITHSYIVNDCKRKGIILKNIERKEFVYKPSMLEVNHNIKKKDIGYLHNSKSGYVYFIKIEKQDVYKIGFTTNPKRRISDISRSSPFIIKVLLVTKSLFAYEMEQKLHEEYKDYALKGEWYLFQNKKAKEVLNKINML